MIFFDSYAILEIIAGNEEYERFKGDSVITNTLNLSEVFYSLLKEGSEKQAKEIIEQIDFEVIELSEEIAVESAMFRRRNKEKKLSYADCIGYVTALKNGMKFLTGDKEFENFKNVEFVK